MIENDIKPEIMSLDKEIAILNEVVSTIGSFNHQI